MARRELGEKKKAHVFVCDVTRAAQDVPGGQLHSRGLLDVLEVASIKYANGANSRVVLLRVGLKAAAAVTGDGDLGYIDGGVFVHFYVRLDPVDRRFHVFGCGRAGSVRRARSDDDVPVRGDLGQEVDVRNPSAEQAPLPYARTGSFTPSRMILGR